MTRLPQHDPLSLVDPCKLSTEMYAAETWGGSRRCVATRTDVEAGGATYPLHLLKTVPFDVPFRFLSPCPHFFSCASFFSFFSAFLASPCAFLMPSDLPMPFSQCSSLCMGYCSPKVSRTELHARTSPMRYDLSSKANRPTQNSRSALTNIVNVSAANPGIDVFDNAHEIGFVECR